MGKRLWTILNSPSALAWVLLLCAVPAWAGIACIAAGPLLGRPALIEVGVWFFLPLLALGIIAFVGGTALVTALALNAFRRRSGPRSRRGDA